MPVLPRRSPASGPAKNISPLRWARVGAMGRIAEIFAGSRSSPAKRNVTNALRSLSVSIFVEEVADRLALFIGDGPVAVYDHAIVAGKVARGLDLVQRAAETVRRQAERTRD